MPCSLPDHIAAIPATRGMNHSKCIICGSSFTRLIRRHPLASLKTAHDTAGGSCRRCYPRRISHASTERASCTAPSEIHARSSARAGFSPGRPRCRTATMTWPGARTARARGWATVDAEPKREPGRSGRILGEDVDLDAARSTIQGGDRSMVQGRCTRMHSLQAREGVRDERGTGTGWHTQGRVRPDVGRQARAVGRQRPPLRGLGDLPPQGIARRPESAVCVAVQRLVRAGDPALQRRRQDAGSRWATSSCTTASPARTSGTTARRTPGSSSASGISSRR